MKQRAPPPQSVNLSDPPGAGGTATFQPSLVTSTGNLARAGLYVFFSYLAFSLRIGSSFFKIMVQCNLGRLRSASFLRSLVESKRGVGRDSFQGSREAPVSGDGRTGCIVVHFHTHPLKKLQTGLWRPLGLSGIPLPDIGAGNACLKVSSGRFLRGRMQMTSDQVFRKFPPLPSHCCLHSFFSQGPM